MEVKTSKQNYKTIHFHMDLLSSTKSYLIHKHSIIYMILLAMKVAVIQDSIVNWYSHLGEQLDSVSREQ